MFCWDARWCAPQHCCVLTCSDATIAAAAEEPSTSNPVAASNFQVASDARLAGDARQTRFVLDLDKTIQFRAFALADPYRVVVDFPRSAFGWPRDRHRGARADQGIPLWPGDAGRFADRVRSDRPGQDRNSYVLDAANGQPPRLVP